VGDLRAGPDRRLAERGSDAKAPFGPAATAGGVGDAFAVFRSTMASDLSAIGVWSGGEDPAFDASAIVAAVHEVREPVHVVRDGSGGSANAGRLGLARGGQTGALGESGGAPASGYALLGTLPALYPEWLGERAFSEAHRVRFPYVVGEMANGIATSRMVIEVAHAQMLAFFGAAGLSLEAIGRGLDEIERALGSGGEAASWGSNLIHSPNDPDLENATAALYIARGVARVSASAYMDLTPAIVRYAAAGLTVDARGAVVRKHHVFAKISRAEVARPFLEPAPKAILDALVAEGLLTPREAALASRVAVAEDITVEADSGGHTDNRPLTALFPSIQQLRDRIARDLAYTRPIRLGAAGGIGTPSAATAAFAMGAAYVLTGSINQGAVESGLSAEGKRMLADVDLADVMMAPAADMFELGVKVQVLKRGTMFGVRALRLYELYTQYESLESMPEAVKSKVERETLHASLREIWDDTRAFFALRDPRELARAERDPKHKMALVFRWYLGKSSHWAIDGASDRRADYQIWCGPAQGAFNAWVKGTFLEAPASRTVVQIARNLLEGAAVVSRAQQLRSYGVPIPAAAFQYTPRPLTS
jgi:trans-AT polyketide synthase/acyltransferase/oxidoreductase domain-containing protein